MSQLNRCFDLKMRTLFNRLDWNRNKKLEAEDLDKWAAKLISFGNACSISILFVILINYFYYSVSLLF